MRGAGKGSKRSRTRSKGTGPPLPQKKGQGKENRKENQLELQREKALFERIKQWTDSEIRAQQPPQNGYAQCFYTSFAVMLEWLE